MINLFNKDLLKKINNNWIFEYIMVFLFVLFGMIGWYYSYSIAGIGVISLTILLVFVFNDFKYFIPAGLCLILSYNGGYLSSTFPIEIASYGVLLIVLMVLYTILNFKLSNFKKAKSYIGIMILAISCILPIFWNSVITEETKLMYFIYFSWVLYVILYFVFGINLGKNSLRMVIFTLSTISVLISFECVMKVFELHKENPNESIFSMAYSLGWGICNEAGILLCFFIPFIFYELIKTKNSIISAFCIVKFSLAVLGLLLTTSRGAVLFGALESASLIILMIVFSKKKITNIVFLSLFILLGVLFIHLNYGIPNLIEDIKNTVFSNGFAGNGREELYSSAVKSWNSNWLTRLLGSGIVSEIRVRSNYISTDTIYIVYHSTFFETLAMGGIVGILALLFHFFEKYRQLWKKELPFVLIMLVGYLAVDAYGMIDNTYGMYYYMLPLVILMASLDNDKNTDIFNYQLQGV